MSCVPLQVIGIDPGPTPGLVLIRSLPVTPHRAFVVQCTAPLLLVTLSALLAYDAGCPTLVQVERFVTRGRATAAQALTRDQVGALTSHLLGTDVRLLQRSASQVKPWATDTRLEAAGLLEATKGMRHARDAARHALYAAVHDARYLDPLSKGAVRA